MTTVVSPPTTVPDTSVVLRHVPWETYESLLADDEERQVPRMTYDQGVLELASPSQPHDEDAQTISSLVVIVAATLGFPIRNVGSMTYRRRDLERGFEPDAGFYVQYEQRLRGRRQIDPSVDPPPDVVLEMEVSRSALNKPALLAAMRAPEVWRSERGRVVILILDGESYRESSVSSAFPMLTSEILTRFLAESQTMVSPEWFHAVMEWARAQRAADRPAE